MLQGYRKFQFYLSALSLNNFSLAGSLPNIPRDEITFERVGLEPGSSCSPAALQELFKQNCLCSLKIMSARQSYLISKKTSQICCSHFQFQSLNVEFLSTLYRVIKQSKNAKKVANCDLQFQSLQNNQISVDANLFIFMVESKVSILVGW